ncbi:MAG: CheR family methyltransferase [Bryobacteraceae bacterium]
MPEQLWNSSTVPELKSSEFLKIREFAHTTFGLDLRLGKERLVSARLGKHLRAGGFRSFDQYLQHVTSDKTGAALITLIDSLTTNHTSFLREQDHFAFLCNTVLQAYLTRRKFRVWCAASSTGEEPYSIALSLLEKLGSAAVPEPQILATDISTRVLEIARRGAYSSERLAGLPRDWVRKYFLRGERSLRDTYQIRADVRAKISFSRVNLTAPFPMGEPFAVVFCRNVMIYFNKETQTDVVNRLAACLEPGGYLFVGHAESLSGIDQPLKYVRPAVYQKRK